MREIKFRGKSVDDVWVYGGLAITSAGLAYIFPNSLQGIEVKRSTVGQYTGLKDIDGQEIYEGDIVTADELECLDKVVFKEGAFFMETLTNRKFDDELLFECEVKIKGNIHENSCLLTRSFRP